MPTSYVAEPVNRLDVCWAAVLHAVAREEAADVQGQVGPNRGKPPGLLVHFRLAVVFTRDDERRDLHVTARRREDDGIFDRLQVAADQIVEPLGKAL